MTVLREGNLQITLNGEIEARKFDGADHGLSHCMKAVDFIVEFSDRYWFIECKDPQTPPVTSKARAAFVREFQSGSLATELQRKYRDSFLYEWASGRGDDKPVDYLVLIALNTLKEAALLANRDDLERKLPCRGPKERPWPRPFVRNCLVFNIEAWNRHLPECPVRRVTEDH